ncbi:hypothetical protein ACJMK2_017499 [Sinanodonta woodiana]|uniref:Uncharacterized protein n=1 Tax=Sinanodonta woodiana TaxID=1069815 RepID=A0ABD3UAJ1_SINWO
MTAMTGLLLLSLVTSGVLGGPDFESVVANYWSWRLENAPEFSTQMGVNTFNDKLQSFGLDMFDSRKTKVEGFVQQLQLIDKSTLSKDQQMSYGVLMDTLNTFLEGYKWRYYGPLNPVTFLEGFYTDLDGFVDVMPFNNESDFRNLIARMNAIPNQVNQSIQLMDEAIKWNHTHHMVSMERILPELSNLDYSILYKPFTSKLDNITSINAAARSQLRIDANRSISEIKSSVLQLSSYLNQIYFKHTRSQWGVSSFDQGKEYYRACLKWHLSIDISPEEVHKRGLAEVERINRQMLQVTQKLNFKGTVREFFGSLNGSTKLYLHTGDAVLEQYRKVVFERAKPKLSKLFKDIPNLPVIIAEMPIDGPAAVYSAGSPDGSRPGRFLVNIKRPTDSPTFSMPAIALHEADPGHHMQDIYSQTTTGIPSFRKFVDYSNYFAIPYHFPFYTAFTEGWGLYAEYLGEEMGIYLDEYEMMGRYSTEIFRACRLVVDTGLHYFNWTRERALDYMLNYTAFSKKNLEVEIDRYITWPGQACAYKIGEMKILELRAKAEQKLKHLFDIRDFHQILLTNGAMPLAIMETAVNDWIEEVKIAYAKKGVLGGPDYFDSIVEDYWSWRLENAPEFSTQIGVNTFNDKLQSFGLDMFDSRKTKVEGFVQQLQLIDKSTLSKDQQMSYGVLMDTLNTFLEGYRWRYYGPLNPVNFLEGFYTDLESFVDVMPFNNESDFRNFIARMNGIPIQVNQSIHLMDEAIKRNHTNHMVSMEKILQELSSLDFSILYKPYTSKLDNITSINAAARNQLRIDANESISAIKSSVLQLSSYLNQTYFKHTRSQWGVSSFDQGKEYYRACLKWHLSIDITPEEVHNKGLAEVDRINRQMLQVTKKLNFAGTVREFFGSLNRSSNFYLQTGNDVLEQYKNIVFERAKPKLSKLFKDIPNLPVIIAEMPTDGPAAVYNAGSPDGSRPGRFLVNIKRPTDSPTFSMPAIALHEADPGHHMQDIYSQTTTGIPNFRKFLDYSYYFPIPYHFPFYTAFIEGWGLYAEYLGEEMGIYLDEYEMMGRYSTEIFRACRLVVDTGLHYFNWTRERALDYMLNYTAFSKKNLEIEIDRYITWPGQACAYKIGEMKILELRAKAEQELKHLFDIREFHKILLTNGLMPLTIMETVVNDWIEEVKIAYAKKGANIQLDELASDFYNWMLELDPEWSTTVGIYKYNDKLESYNYTVFESRKNISQRILEQLLSIKREDLDKTHAVSYDILKNILKTYIDGYRWWKYQPLNPFIFLEGFVTDPQSFVDVTPLDTYGDFLNFIIRVEKMPHQYDEMMEDARLAIKYNHTMNNVSMDRIPQQIDELTSKESSFPLIGPFLEDKAAIILGSTLKNLTERMRQAIKNLIQKLKAVKSFIHNEYMPNTRKTWGILGWENGTQNYIDSLKWHTSLPNTPEEVHQKGLDEVKRIHDEMIKTMRRLGYHGSVRDFFDLIKSNSSFLIRNPDSTLQRFREIIFQRITPVLPKYFKNLPNLPLVVKNSPQDGVGGEYESGSGDGTRPGTFYANVRRPEDNPTFAMVSLSLHETVPGHHLADSYSLVSDLPPFRKHMNWRLFSAPFFFPFFNSYVEGWALYAEYLGEEMGIYRDDFELMGRYSDEIFRACRLVIDTGLHYFGWDRDRAIEYLLNYTDSTREGAVIEIDRYITWPGQACGYKMGELKIKELRQKASKELGAHFDLPEFHYVILSNGPMPLDVLENVIDNWINDVKLASKVSPKPNNTISSLSMIRSPSNVIFCLLFLALLFR